MGVFPRLTTGFASKETTNFMYLIFLLLHDKYLEMPTGNRLPGGLSYIAPNGKKGRQAGGPDDDETSRGQWSGRPVRKFRLTTTHADIRNGNIPGFFHATKK